MRAELASAPRERLQHAFLLRAGACGLPCRLGRARTSTTYSPAMRRLWRAIMASHSAGAEAVRESVRRAEDVKPEPPRPLMRELPPADPFPVDALGEVLVTAARAIHDRVQAPLAICGQSVLAAAALANQGHADVELPIGPGQSR